MGPPDPTVSEYSSLSAGIPESVVVIGGVALVVSDVHTPHGQRGRYSLSVTPVLCTLFCTARRVNFD